MAWSQGIRGLSGGGRNLINVIGGPLALGLKSRLLPSLRGKESRFRRAVSQTAAAASRIGLQTGEIHLAYEAVSNDSRWRQVCSGSVSRRLSRSRGRSACRLSNANIGHSKIASHASSKFIFSIQTGHLTPLSSAFPSAPPLRHDIVKVAVANTRQIWLCSSGNRAAPNWLCSLKTYGDEPWIPPATQQCTPIRAVEYTRVPVHARTLP